MDTFLKWWTVRRFNYIDILFFSFFMVAMHDFQYMIAFGILVIGAVISVIIEKKVNA